MRLTYKSLDDSIADRLDSFFNKNNSFIEVNPGNVIMPRLFQDIGDEVLSFNVRQDDVWMVSYPRTGSTWAQEMIWLLANNLNYEGAKHLQQLRSPLLELSAYFQEDHNTWLKSNMGTSVKLTQSLPSPRFIKSHLPWQLLPKNLSTVNPKIIYIARNAKDTCVSFYHYLSLIHKVVGSFEEFCNLFLEDNLVCGSMWKHMLGFWNHRNDTNILFLKYEDMKKDLRGAIYQCAEFLNVSHKLNDEEVSRMCAHLNFDKMQRNRAVNLEALYNPNGDETDEKNSVKFIRKGQIGDWKNYMSDEMSERFDEWIERNSYGTGLSFEYN
ncbi:Luciferin sulfotransferase [Pseudolycoriella hygida]|uniref:Luciferin sulfotransferase n=1 Tax=Pseudolycoriella hygida TaxID=35572 RepID=A0A9Q0MPF2_9DIPT|nr:Luciferin sulfotransferase [Pseudolycoriella hygida]